jgi:hypothetical protein
VFILCAALAALALLVAVFLMPQIEIKHEEEVPSQGVPAPEKGEDVRVGEVGKD